jgi:hypothetical protein
LPLLQRPWWRVLTKIYSLVLSIGSNFCDKLSSASIQYGIESKGFGIKSYPTHYIIYSDSCGPRLPTTSVFIFVQPRREGGVLT